MIRGDVRLPNGFVCDVDTQAVIYPVAMPKLPREFWDTALRTYKQQPRSHLTLVSRSEGGKLGFKEFVELTDIVTAAEPPYIQTSGQIWSIHKEKRVGKKVYQRESLLVPCISDDLTDLYRKLAKFGIGSAPSADHKLDAMPFWHITLATKGDQELPFKGIGVRTIAEWRSLKPQLYYSGFAPQKVYGVPLAA